MNSSYTKRLGFVFYFISLLVLLFKIRVRLIYLSLPLLPNITPCTCKIMVSLFYKPILNQVSSRATELMMMNTYAQEKKDYTKLVLQKSLFI